jgi:predicted nucleic acid-binding protein
LLLKSAHTDLAEQVYAKDSIWAAPVLWRSEFRNVLAGYLRRDLLDLAEARQFNHTALRLMSGREHLPQGDDVLRFVSLSNCSAYDCEFVAVARGLGAFLVTADRRILADFPQFAVSPEDFVR